MSRRGYHHLKCAMFEICRGFFIWLSLFSKMLNKITYQDTFISIDNRTKCYWKNLKNESLKANKHNEI